MVLVAVRDPLAVGGWHGLPAQDLAVVGELLGLADAVRGQGPNLDLARGVRQRDQAIVLQKPSYAQTLALLVRGLDQPALTGRRDVHAAASGQRDAVAVR